MIGITVDLNTNLCYCESVKCITSAELKTKSRVAELIKTLKTGGEIVLLHDEERIGIFKPVDKPAIKY